MKKEQFFYFLIFIPLFFFILHRVVWRTTGWAEQAYSCCLYPVLILNSKISGPIQSFLQQKKTLRELDERLAEIEQKNLDLQAENVELKLSVVFSQETEELVSFKSKYSDPKAVLAQIVLVNISEQAHFYLVDQGSCKGIEKDMVAVYKNILVGRVAEVYPFYSKVVLTTDVSCKVGVDCFATGACGIFEGMNSTELGCMNYVSHLAKLQKEDLVFSNGGGVVFPKGFALGRIDTFELDGLYYKIKVKPLLDWNSLKYCYLMHKGES
ncbi:MAG: Cell shape-determining protein MreC [candidate division TM6 bacterium GW2011_GWF2_32_72]|nr:MAG: Cell shape-determining protein MreC [candidate division TM6 bacterium GW2011_GWF2_32_72]